MRAFRSIRNTSVFFAIILGLLSCDSWFSYSPYEAELDPVYHGTTDKNLTVINSADAGDSKPFKVALLSDPHYHFSKLHDAIRHINKKSDYAFVIVTGDLSENGLRQEFIFFYESMKELRLPYVTVIGNHDYLSNGELVYTQMYGAYNYSFVFNNVKFVMFDNTTLESEKEPDMDWLADNLINDHGYDHVIPFSHIPPYDGQMKKHSGAYHALMVKNQVTASIHGHRHEFSLNESYGDGVRYVTVSSPQYRTYSELTITPTGIDIQKIEY
jgi:3',5'-cyclic AMP phosphodiesterase CpdA